MVEPVKYEVNYKNITVKTIDGSMITGKVNIQNFQRLSDMLKHSMEKYLTITSEKGAYESKQVTIVNRQYIIWAKAED
jgi:hypothetical protein